jgi:cytochrome c oxidase subunit 3
MAGSHAKPHHDYHLVDPSPWPVVGSIGAFLMTGGMVMAFYDRGPWVSIIGFAIVLYTMVAWWRDVVEESRADDHTPVVQLGLRYGMVLFIASEVMFFVAWFWAYFHNFFDPAPQVGGVWPPQGIETFDPWHLPLLNTLILLTSGTTVTWAHHALQTGDRKGLVQGLILTVLLGMSFTGLQAVEYSHAGFAFAGNIYGATFFMASTFWSAQSS